MTDRSILVSVIIPVFNVAPYLAEALNSVLCQTYSNLEIIVVDDGSTDGSGKICDEFASIDKRIHVIHQKNKGLSAARNVGLDILTGHVVSFLDSDDAYQPDFIMAMLDRMTEAGADIVICKRTKHKTAGEMRQNGNESSEPKVGEGIYTKAEILRAIVNGTMNHGVWNKIYKKELWCDIRFPEGRVFEDIATIHRIINQAETICVIDRPLYLYRIRSDSISRTCVQKNVADWVSAHIDIESFICDNIPDIFSAEDLIKARRSRINRMLVYYAKLSLKGFDANKPFCDSLREQIIDLADEAGIRGCKFRTKIGYYMIKRWPGLLRMLYPYYQKIHGWMLTTKPSS